MKTKSALVGMMGILVIVVLLGASFQSGEDLFQKALRLERNEGKLGEAIVLYQKIVNESKDQPLAAKAQLRIGLCYEKLGTKATKQAQEAFQRVIDNYPQQLEEVETAREKLTVLLRARPAMRSDDQECIVRKVWDKAVDYTYYGSPSPDGRYITFTDYGNYWGLGIRDLQKNESRLLTQKKSGGAALWSIFSPSGSQVAYTWQRQKDGGGELRLIGMEGGEPSIIYDGEGFPFPASWTKDGNHILVELRKAEVWEAAFVSVKDGSIRKLRSFPSKDYKLQGMSLSPDGLYIAIGMIKDGHSSVDMHIMSADGNNLRPLVTHPARDIVLGWSPDSKHVFFMSDRTGSDDLWAIPVDDGKPGGDPVLVKPSLGNVRPLGLTPKGSLYFGILTGWSDIFVAEIDPETGKVLSPPVMAVQKYEGFNSAPDWSSDGRYLVCRSSRGKPHAGSDVGFLIRSTQTDEIREVIPQSASGLNFHFVRCSPDGRSILGVGNDEEGNYGVLWDIDAETGASEVIARHTEMGIISQPEWAPDGKSVFFKLNVIENHAIKNQKILQHDIESGEEKEIYNTPPRIVILTLSPDGRQLAFSAGDTIQLLSTTGGEPRDLVQAKDVDSITWSADGRFLFYGKKRDDKSHVVEVWRIPVEGGEPERLDLAMNQLMHLRMDPSGRKLAFTASIRNQTSDIWVMENFLPKTERKK